MAIYTYSEELSFAWDAWAQSEEILELDGYFEFSVYNSAGIVCGLSPIGIPQHNASIAHGFFIEGLAYRVIESGVPVGTQAAFSPSDRFRIERHGESVLYFKNDSLLREVPVSYVGASRLYAALYSYFDNVTDAVMVVTTSEAEVSASLPAFESKAFTDHHCTAAGIFPAYVGISESSDTSTAISLLPGIVSASSTDEVSYCVSTLPALSSYSEQSVLSPDVTSSMSALPGLNSYSEAEDSPWLDDELPALGMVGLSVDEEFAEDNVAISFSELPAYSALADMAEEAWLDIEVLLPAIVQFQLAPTLHGRLFTIKGLLEGTSLYCEISGRIARLRGEMDTGGLMAGELAVLQGKAFGSAASIGQIDGKVGELRGEAQTGGLMAGELYSLSGVMAGNEISTGVIDGRAFGLKGTVNALPVHIGIISGRAFSLKGEMSGSAASLGKISGQVSRLSGSLSGATSEVAKLSGKVFRFRGKMTGTELAVCSLGGNVFILDGSMRAIVEGIHVTMRYVRR